MLHLVILLLGCFSLLSAQSAMAEPVKASSTLSNQAANGSLVTSSSTSLGIALLKHLCQKPNNIFISPLSINCCLQMALSGAAGNTAAQMRKAMFLPAVDMSFMQSDYKAFRAELAPEPESNPYAQGRNVVFEIANSLWANKGVRIKSEFPKILNTVYDAECRTLDFKQPSAAGTINSWVSKKTHEKINSIIDQLDQSDLLVLINTAYFKGRWEREFDKSDTKPMDFHVNGVDAANKVLTMHRYARLGYYEDPSVQLVQLGYVDYRYSMYIFLPERKTSIDHFVAALTPDRFGKLMNSVQERPGELWLPKFKMDYRLQLGPIMQQLGMIDAFNAKSANFTGMVVPPPPAFISAIIHKTYVDLNEEGTEAAAVTALMMAGSAMPVPAPPFKMAVDRPFMFALVNRQSKALIFAGIMADPRY